MKEKSNEIKRKTEIFRGDDGKHYGKFCLMEALKKLMFLMIFLILGEWVRFFYIGLKLSEVGSPRPIKDYLTSEVDGINWIKNR